MRAGAPIINKYKENNFNMLVENYERRKKNIATFSKKFLKHEPTRVTLTSNPAFLL